MTTVTPPNGRSSRLASQPRCAAWSAVRVADRERPVLPANRPVVDQPSAVLFERELAPRLPAQREIGPQRAAEETHAADRRLAAIEDLHLASGCRFAERRLCGVELAVVRLVVAGDVEHRRGELRLGPFDACRAVVDVAGEDDHVGRCARRIERRRFEVQVGEDPDAHRL
jgi:hypothetical protein